MNEIFIKRLTYLLNKKGLKPADLSRLTGIRASSISDWLTGKYTPKQDKIALIADVLGVSAAWLMGYENHPTPLPPYDNIIPIRKKSFPVLGDIAAGVPIEAQQHVETYVTVDDDFDADYALRVKGDSMVGGGIKDGDIVFIKQQPQVENGEIAAVYVDGGATLKKVFKIGESVMLQSMNPDYKEMVFSADNCQDFKILGKAVKRLTDIK